MQGVTDNDGAIVKKAGYLNTKGTVGVAFALGKQLYQLSGSTDGVNVSPWAH